MTREFKEIEDKATEEFMKNPYWKELYENAPGLAKDYYRLSFGYTLMAMFAKGDHQTFESLGIDKERDRVYMSMSDAEWDYVLRTSEPAVAMGLQMWRDRHKESGAKE